jgi:hypothetical protein
MISTNEPRWGRMDLAVAQRRDVSAIAKVVYAVLKCYENKKTGKCDPSQNMLADDAGASIGSVKRAIKQLIDARIIEADRTPGSSRNAYRFLDPRVQNDTSIVSKCDLHGIKMIPPGVQNDTSSLYKDDKKRKEQEKNRKRNAGEKQADLNFVNPDLRQQEIADDLIARWDAKYPHTTILADMVADQMAFIQLQTIHRQSRADIEQIIDANAESIKYWTRPKSLMCHIRNDDDQPLVWQRIKSDAMRASQPPPKEPIYTRETGDQYKEIYARFAATGKI